MRNPIFATWKSRATPGSALARIGRSADHAFCSTPTAALAEVIAGQIGADVGHAMRAAKLAKADLATGMVGEFPELQGIMGGYYARHEGLRDGVAIAIEDHYKPRFAGDTLPRNRVGVVVALAQEFGLPVHAVGVGEKAADLRPFAARDYARSLVGLDE